MVIQSIRLHNHNAVGEKNKTNIHFSVTLYLQRESELFKESDAGGFEAQ